MLYHVEVVRTGIVVVEAESTDEAFDKVLSMPAKEIDKTLNLSGWEPSDVINVTEN